MRFMTGVALIAAAAMAAPASAQSFVGTWTATAVAPGGAVSEELTVARDGAGYTITVKPIGERPPGLPEAGPGIEIVLEGDSFAYKRRVDIPDMEIVVTYVGTVEGDKFTGTAEVGGFEVPYLGVRSSAGDRP